MSWPYDEYVGVVSSGDFDQRSEWVTETWLEVGPLGRQDGVLLMTDANDKWLWLFVDGNPSFAKILSRVTSNSPRSLKVVGLSKPTHYAVLPWQEEAEGGRDE